MKRATKMMLLNRGNESRDRQEHDGMAYDRFRDSRGREHYDSGRYAPMRSEGDYWMEGRFRDRDGREHYDNGRFSPMKNEYDGGTYAPYETSMNYPDMPYIPPIYREDGRHEFNRRESDWGMRPMNKIGFALEGEMNRLPEMNPEYRQMQEYRRMDEMNHMKGGERMAGYGNSSVMMPFTKEVAESWTHGMKNEDGSNGPHWTMDQTKQVQAQRNINCDPVEFYAIINSIYSDYCKVAKKHNVNTIDFYADMAKAWLDDEDAVNDKATAYFEYIVKH